ESPSARGDWSTALTSPLSGIDAHPASSTAAQPSSPAVRARRAPLREVCPARPSPSRSVSTQPALPLRSPPGFLLSRLIGGSVVDLRTATLRPLGVRTLAVRRSVIPYAPGCRHHAGAAGAG